ncbi:MAG: hypothetical protein K2X82_20585, partial [Gemmataceae bacterium]|nr:hypothetical protein [Gemmataceae bacterium]
RARRGWAGLTAGLLTAVVAAVLVWGGTGRPVEPPAPVVPDLPLVPEPEPQTAEEFIARGRQRAAANRPEGALADFEAAAALDPGPRPLALLAYVHTGKGNWQLAIDFGLAAIKAGATSAAVYSNLGWAYLRRPSEQRPALVYLDEAVRIDPEFIPARLNRAQARYRLTMGADWRLPNLGSVDDLRVVLAANPEAAEVYFLAARVWAASAHLDPDLRDEAVRHLGVATRLGDDPTRFQDEPVLKEHLAGHPVFDQFARMAKPAPGTIRWLNLRVVDPEGR